MKGRNRKITIHLSEYEFAILDEQVAKTGYSKESYVRTLLKGFIPNEAPPLEYHKLMNGLRNVANNMNQIAAKANATNLIDAMAYNQNAQNLYSIIREIQEAVLLPKEIKNGNH